MAEQPYLRKVNFYETDQMGVVHHANYIRWLEEAREDFLSRTRLRGDTLWELGIRVPVISCSCTYKRPTRYASVVAIYTKLHSYNGIRFSFRYEVRFPDSGKLAARGETSHCFVDARMKPINIGRRYPDLHEEILALLQEETVGDARKSKNGARVNH